MKNSQMSKNDVAKKMNTLENFKNAASCSFLTLDATLASMHRNVGHNLHTKSHKSCIQQQRAKTPQPTKMQPNCVLHRLPHRGHFRCLDSVLLKSKQTIMLTVSQEKEVSNALA
jgi:hypothetical protein